MKVCALPTGTKNVLYMVYLVVIPALTSLSTALVMVIGTPPVAVIWLCKGSERDMPAVISSHWTIQKHFWEGFFFVITAVVVLNFTELTYWNINNIQVAVSESFSISLYLNNSKSCTLNLCKPSTWVLIDRKYLTIDISGAGRVSTSHLPSFICSPPAFSALNSFSKVSFFPSFNIPFSLHQRSRVWSLDISQYSLVAIS